jgi:hypothetical protein
VQISSDGAGHDGLVVEPTAESEGRRWAALVETALGVVPDLESWLEETHEGSDFPAWWTPGDVWTELAARLLDDEDFPKAVDDETWTQLLAYLEIVEEVLDGLEDERGGEDQDVVTLHAFANAGILHEISRNRDGLASLLPRMGPRVTAAVRGEVELHNRLMNDWDGREVDWSVAGRDFRPLPGTASRLRPVDCP